MGLKGKRALVTGSARGIGRRVIERLAGAGCDVAVHYRTRSEAAKALVAAMAARGVRAAAFQADVTVEGEVRALLEGVGDELGGLDILVNNVGDFLVKSIARIESAEWHAIIDSNLHSVFYCCRAALPMMRRAGWGRIVNGAWVNAEFAKSAPMTTPYEIAKTGVVTLSKSFAVEEAAHGITVNVVSPGVIDNSRLSPERRDATLREIPVGRFGTPDDIAGAILYLVSDEAAYVTGANLTVGGGWHLGRHRYYRESILGAAGSS